MYRYSSVGAGAKMKLIVNSVMGSMMASFAEGLVLTDKAGLDADTMLQVISLVRLAVIN